MKFDVILIGVTLAIGIAAFVIAAVTFVNLRKAHGLWQLAFMFLLEGVYATAYALELAAVSIEMKVFFNHIQYFAIPFLAPIWFFIAMKFWKRERNPAWWQVCLALLVPTIIMVSVQITYYTPFDWYYTSTTLLAGTNATLGIDVLVLGKGPLYYVAAIHNLIVLALVGFVYVKVALTSRGIKRTQAGLLAAFGFTASIFISTTLFSAETFGIDYVLYAITIISYIVLYSLFRFELFILTPSAHQATFENALDPIVVMDDHYQIDFWNAAVSEFGMDILTYHQPLEESFLPAEIVESIMAGETVRFEHHGKRFIAETFPLFTKHGAKNGFIVRFNDMTSYLERMEKLDYEASHDSLTNIYNRRAFNEAAAAYLQDPALAAAYYSVMMIDIDDFKVVNDTYGHPVGDVVLEELSRVIECHLKGNAIFARYGGEEFVVFVKGAKPEAARALAEEIRIDVEMHPFIVGELTLCITVSIGIKGARVGVGTVKEAIKGADEAMYISKRSNKNVVTTVL